jgi:hypothetical protein
MHNLPERVGASLVATGLVLAGGWITAVETTTRAHIPTVPIWIFAGMVVIGAVLFAGARGWFPWHLRRKSQPPLKVVAREPHYHDWNYAASVAALPVMVTNKTGADVTLVGGCLMESNSGGIVPWETRLTEDEEGLFRREVESQVRTSHHQPSLTKGATIPAHASLELWHVIDISRDRSGTRPGATLRFKDSDGNEYMAVFKRQEPHKARSASPLTGAPDGGTV